MVNQGLHLLFLLVFPVLVITAALRDLTTFTIPNWISLALLAAFFPAALVSGAGLTQVGICLGIGVAALALGVFMFAMGWIGGGDAKLLAAASLWMGWPQIMPFLVYTALAGGVLAMSLIGLRSGWVRRYAVSGPSWVGRLAAVDGPAPYGVAIAAGALLAFPQSLLAAI